MQNVSCSEDCVDRLRSRQCLEVCKLRNGCKMIWFSVHLLDRFGRSAAAAVVVVVAIVGRNWGDSRKVSESPVGAWCFSSSTATGFRSRPFNNRGTMHKFVRESVRSICRAQSVRCHLALFAAVPPSSRSCLLWVRILFHVQLSVALGLAALW